MELTPLQIMDLILDGVVKELRRKGRANDLCLKTLMPGENVVADSQCGLLVWVRLDNAFEYQTFPTPLTDSLSCGHSLGFALEVGVLRATEDINLKVFGSHPEMPDESEWTSVTSAQIEDMLDLRQGIITAAAQIAENDGQLSLGQYAPSGPDGGVVGGSWAVTAGVG